MPIDGLPQPTTTHVLIMINPGITDVTERYIVLSVEINKLQAEEDGEWAYACSVDLPGCRTLHTTVTRDLGVAWTGIRMQLQSVGECPKEHSDRDVDSNNERCTQCLAADSQVTISVPPPSRVTSVETSDGRSHLTVQFAT